MALHAGLGHADASVAAAPSDDAPPPPTLGLRANWRQFSLLVLVHAFVGGWLVGLPVPFLVMWAPTWGWVVFANVLLGVNQGLAWSTTVIMKIDLVGPERRGFAMGLNEAAGYGAVALAALVTGIIAEEAGLRPEPFFLGIAFAGLGLTLSCLFVRETRGHARYEASLQPDRAAHLHADVSTRE